jgi:regulatory protein YycI of two-component signal transduction system YycFG
MEWKKLSIIFAVIVGISTLINIVLSIIVPRSEIKSMEHDIYLEINRIEIKMMENDIVRREEQKCSLLHNDITEFRECISLIKHNEALRYMSRNK